MWPKYYRKRKNNLYVKRASDTVIFLVQCTSLGEGHLHKQAKECLPAADINLLISGMEECTEKDYRTALIDYFAAVKVLRDEFEKSMFKRNT